LKNISRTEYFLIFDYVKISGKKMLDFTLKMFRKLCDEVKDNKYVPITVTQYCDGMAGSNAKNIIFRHDVDREIGMAFVMAEIEHDMNIRATYYFRFVPEVFRPETIGKIGKLDHEIGYHYEVLDRADGDTDKAIRLFEQELGQMRRFADIRTACMHGNPLKPWSNRDLWKTYDFRKFGIVGEPYLSIDYEKFGYFSDTGRTWSGAYSVKDVVDREFSEKIRHTPDVISLLRSGRPANLCLLIHPNRWTDNPFLWSRELLWQNIKNIGKKILKRNAVFSQGSYHSGR
jgi:hypothetical protein